VQKIVKKILETFATFNGFRHLRCPMIPLPLTFQSKAAKSIAKHTSLHRVVEKQPIHCQWTLRGSLNTVSCRPLLTRRSSIGWFSVRCCWQRRMVVSCQHGTLQSWNRGLEHVGTPQRTQERSGSYRP